MSLTVVDLAAVIYSAGKVFDRLSVGLLDTERFLESGNTDGIFSRPDLALLQDLRDVAAFIIERAPLTPVDTAFVAAINGRIKRSGAIHAGVFRTDDQNVAVKTPHGRHEPLAVTHESFQAVITQALDGEATPVDQASRLFMDIAKAQPFGDGNKRTALFAANAHLIHTRTPALLTVPVDDNDVRVQAAFNDFLARYYVYGQSGDLKSLLQSRGVQPIAQEPRRSARQPGIDRSHDMPISPPTLEM